MHYHNPFHQKRHTTKASHGIKFVTSITTTIALILVCALAVSQIIPTDRTNRSAKVAQGKTTRSKKPVKTTFTPASGEFRGVWISFQDIGETPKSSLRISSTRRLITAKKMDLTL